MSDRVENYDKGMENLKTLEQILDTSPEYQLPKPQGLMSAKSYKNKVAEPLVQKLKSSGRLSEYLASVDEQAEAMFSRLVKKYADRQGVTKQLKTENQLEWVGEMNNTRSRVIEVINTEIIYSK